MRKIREIIKEWWISKLWISSLALGGFSMIGGAIFLLRSVLDHSLSVLGYLAWMVAYLVIGALAGPTIVIMGIKARNSSKNNGGANEP